MQNFEISYKAEVDYRHEQIAREFRPLSARRAARAAARKQGDTRTHAA